MDDEITSDEFLAFLLDQARIRESDNATRTKATLKKDKPEYEKREKSELQFRTAAVPVQYGSECFVGGGNHLTDDCPRFMRHPVPERWHCVQRLHISIVNLQKGHRKEDFPKRKAEQALNALLE
ncbi:hypothetical protein T07_10043 [Trichinella nelsoni]|uniref:Uncharacterized protein n=1 Tax=Trichinella nelsoni TaxID=6336 RepID=A0A0V0RZP3_9BILA|nr:hypothetical protein T07_10043 [Trichinella nelsoni]